MLFLLGAAAHQSSISRFLTQFSHLVITLPLRRLDEVGNVSHQGLHLISIDKIAKMKLSIRLCSFN